MIRTHLAQRLILVGLAVFSYVGAASAQGVVASDATNVIVRKDCTITVGGTQSEAANCFQTLAAAQAWIPTRTVPTDPLLVEVGAGVWAETWTCQGFSNVNLRGAGRDNTIITGPGGTGPGIAATDCDNVEFSDLAARAQGLAVEWTGSGTASWNNVDLESLAGGAESWAFTDSGCQAGQTEPAHHQFYGSHLIAEASPGDGTQGVLRHTCSTTRFYGGELFWKAKHLSDGASGGATFGANSATVFIQNESAFEGYGVAIRTILLGGGNPIGGSLVAVRVIGPATPVAGAPRARFALNGGILNVTIAPTVTSTGYLDGTGLWLTDHAVGNTVATAWAMPTPPAPVLGQTPIHYWRVYTEGDAQAEASLLWQPSAGPPSSPDEKNVVNSEDGQDIFLETDCSAEGDCASGGDAAHLMVFNPALCSGIQSRGWLNAVTGRCRNVTDDPLADAIDALETAQDALELQATDLDQRVTALEGGP